jgi:hypothetical protein
MKELVRRRINPFTRFSLLSIVGSIVLSLLSSTILNDQAYGQIVRNIGPSTPAFNMSFSAPSATSQQHTLHMVKIISPAKGERVPVGNDLAISGISAANSNSTSINCQISVIVNSLKPYQKATPTGQNGSTDYSKWNFTLTSKYTSIKEGQNKITAKYSCPNNPTSISHNSVNVTGVLASNANTTTTSTTNGNGVTRIG